MNPVLPPFLFILMTGCIWRFLPRVPDAARVREALGAVIIFVFLPFFAFNIMRRAEITPDLWRIPVISVATILFAAATAWLIYGFLIRAVGSWARHVDRPLLGALLLASAWGNITFLGLPIVTGYFGNEMARVAVLFDMYSTMPLLFTLGAVIGVVYGKSRVRLNARNMASTILTLPPFIGATLGLIFNLLNFPVPEFFTASCEIMGRAVAPVMIFSVGLALRVPRLARIAWFAPAIAIKLLLSPLFAGWLGIQIGLSGPVLSATMLEAGMATMVVTLMISDRFGLDSEALAQAIAVSTALSFLTLPLWV